MADKACDGGRRMVLKGLAGACVAVSLAGCGGSDDDDARVGTWGGALGDLKEVGAAFGPIAQSWTDKTVRQAAHIAVGGDRVRIRCSNLYGSGPVAFQRVRLARSAGPGAIVVDTDTAVTFNGAPTVTIAPGQQVWSDAIAFPVAAGADLAVSIHVRETSDATTVHLTSLATQHVNDGDVTRAAALRTDAASALISGYWMSAIDVERSNATPVLVAFGDSITDGFASTPDANHRYPDFLAARLRATPGQEVSVVNAGLSGNRWLHDFLGLRGVERFKRDVLSVTGVTHTLVLLGINDIGMAATSKPDEPVSAAELIAAIGGAVSAARAAGIKVYVGTLLPYKGADYYTEGGEAIRQAVNAWIRAGAGADAVVDFDAALRDPADPLRLLPEADCGDHLHPSDAGYQRMADTVPLNLLR